MKEVGLSDEVVPDGLVEVEEHEGHVLSDVLFDLADPLGVILAIVDKAEVSLEA